MKAKWRIGFYPMWRFEVKDFEYWRRYCVGCFYALRWHQSEMSDETRRKGTHD